LVVFPNQLNNMVFFLIKRQIFHYHLNGYILSSTLEKKNHKFFSVALPQSVNNLNYEDHERHSAATHYIFFRSLPWQDVWGAVSYRQQDQADKAFCAACPGSASYPLRILLSLPIQSDLSKMQNLLYYLY
jgi:hypothetical protein